MNKLVKLLLQVLVWPVVVIFRWFDGDRLSSLQAWSDEVLKDDQDLDNEGFLKKVQEDNLTKTLFPTEFAKKVAEIYGATGCVSTAAPLDIQNKDSDKPEIDTGDERVICLD